MRIARLALAGLLLVLLPVFPGAVFGQIIGGGGGGPVSSVTGAGTISCAPTVGAVICTGSGGGTPGGSNTQVQFNDAGAFGGDAGLTYDKTTDTLTIGTAAATGLTLTGSTLAAIGAGADGPLVLAPKGEGALHLKVDGNVGSNLQTLYIGPSTTITNSPIPNWGPGVMFADDFGPLTHLLGPFPGIQFWDRGGSNLVPTKTLAPTGLGFISFGGYTGSAYHYTSELHVDALYDWDVRETARWLFKNAVISLLEMAAPPVSESGVSALYADSTSHTLKLSMNTGAYSDIITTATLPVVVTSLAGTANQITASAATGAVTLSLPQSIATTSTPQFLRLGIGVAAPAVGVGLPSSTFASLGSPADGTVVLCSNCDPGAVVTCTAVATQTGALAFRTNGAWKCAG